MARYMLINGRMANPDEKTRARIAEVISRELPVESGEPIQPIYGADEDWLSEHIGEVEIVFGGIAERYLPQAESLKWIQLQGAGVEGSVRWLTERPEIVITNASGVHGVPIAEHFIAMMYAFARKMPDFYRLQSNRIWDRSTGEGMTEVTGKHVLVVGYGSIGRTYAHMMSALGLTVTAVKRTPQSDADATVPIHDSKDLLLLLPDADFVANILPYTDKTDTLFDATAFDAMKQTAYFLNAGRGKTVDEPALIHALETGGIAGAGLDVFESEPLPADSPLWSMQNVIVTPHIAGLTPEYDARLLAIFLPNLSNYLSGREMVNVLDRSRGY